MRPEPTAILAACAARDGRTAEAAEYSRLTVDADPRNWEWWYLARSSRAPRVKIPVKPYARRATATPWACPPQVC